MATNYDNTLVEMRELANQHTTVAVAFSGGKDSLCTLDLAQRFFKTVYPFYLYLVPGLQVDDDVLSYAEKRFNTKVMRYQHPLGPNAWRTSVYCDPFVEFDVIPKLTMVDSYRMVMADTGATLILNGEKKADGAYRRHLIANTTKTQEFVYRPLKTWLRWEVLSYLKAQKLDEGVKESTLPDASSFVGLSFVELLWLNDNYPDDFSLLAEYFPYIQAVVERRRIYGLSTYV